MRYLAPTGLDGHDDKDDDDDGDDDAGKIIWSNKYGLILLPIFIQREL